MEWELTDQDEGQRKRSRILVTGAAGFLGAHVITTCAMQGHQVLGIVRNTLPRDDKNQLENVKSPAGSERVEYVRLDLLDGAAVARAIESFQPSLVFHLAAQSSTARSWQNPVGTYENNLLTQVNVLEACLHLDRLPRILVAGSSDEYGAAQGGNSLIPEAHPLLPVSPYGVTKVGQDLMARQYFFACQLPTIVVRPFLMIGPGRSDTFFSGAFARQVVSVSLGLQDPVVDVGNVDLVRDITDVRDVARACLELVSRGVAGEVYNVGSEKGTTLRILLEEMLRSAAVEAEIRQTHGGVRYGEPRSLVADCTKLRRETGWRPQISLQESVVDMLDDWRRRLLERRSAPLSVNID